MSAKDHLRTVLQDYYDCIVEEDVGEGCLKAEPEKILNFFGVDHVFNNTDELFWYMCDNLVHPDDLVKLDLFRKVDLAKRFEQGESGVEVEFRMKDQKGRYVWVSMTVLFELSKEDHSVIYYVSMFRNIEAEKKNQLQNEILARKDAMTGLCNRNYTEFLVGKMMEKKLSGQGYVMLVMDIDDFKMVNDSYGHLTGDMVIKEVARRLAMSFDKGIVGRIGGDEFMVFFEYDGTKEEVIAQCDSKRKELSFQYHENTFTLYIHCSMGMYFNPKQNRSYIKAFEFADKALYEAKSKGKNNLCVSKADEKI